MSESSSSSPAAPNISTAPISNSNTPRSNPWNRSNCWNTPSTDVSLDKSLADVMSEQLVEKLNLENQEKLDREKTPTKNFSETTISTEIPIWNADNDTNSDELLAKMLQQQLDHEYNQELKYEERKLNSKSGRVQTSFRNYKIELGSSFSSSHSHDNNFDESSPSEDEELQEYLEYQSDQRLVGKHLIWDDDRQEYISKHDTILCNQRNAQKVKDLDIATGTNIDSFTFSTKITNNLTKYANKEMRSKARLHENKEKSTAEHAVDDRTRKILFKLVNSGSLDGVNGVISIGKEAVVLHAKGGSETPLNQNSLHKPIPENIAVKVFKTTMAEFRNRDKYIAEDYRFQDRFKKLNSRKLAYLWEIFH